MKNLFLLTLCGLVVFTQVIQFRAQSLGGLTQNASTVYWVTDPHPARKEQVRIFKEWLKAKSYPDIQIKLDTANQGIQKTIIQGVTGVAGDLVDVYGGVPFLADTGMIEEMTPLAKEFGLKDSDLFQPAYQDYCFNGKRYATPKNVGMNLFFVNVDLFEKIGMTPPPRRWDLDTFEKTGLEFDRRANAGLPKRKNFFANQAHFSDLRRSAGVSTFNETLTACAIQGPKAEEILKRLHRWKNEYHIIPSDADRQSIAVEQGYGDSFFQLFNNGHCGLLFTGRWALIQIRAMKNNPRMTASEIPHGGYPSAFVFGSSVILYKGSRQKNLAKYFHAFLMSDAYNKQVLRDVDSLPTITRFMDEPEFLTPSGHTNEWPAHGVFRDVALTIAHGREISPFINSVASDKIEIRAVQGFMSGIHSAEKALALAVSETDTEIQKQLSKRPALKEQFEKALLRQKKIDAIKASGGKIPLELVDNPFLKRYYADTGRGATKM